MPPFVQGKRYRAVLLIVWTPYIRERTVQTSAQTDHGVPSKTLIMVAPLKTPKIEEATHSL